MSDPEFTIDPVFAWKYIHVIQFPLRMISPIYTHQWYPYQADKANCRRSLDVRPIDLNYIPDLEYLSHEPATHELCHCGFHALPLDNSTSWYTMSMRRYAPAQNYLLLMLYGRVAEHQLGWRASHAMPVGYVGSYKQLCKFFYPNLNNLMGDIQYKPTTLVQGYMSHIEHLAREDWEHGRREYQTDPVDRAAQHEYEGKRKISDQHTWDTYEYRITSTNTTGTTFRNNYGEAVAPAQQYITPHHFWTKSSSG